MELGLAGANRCPRVARRERRLHRANWWFDQMRQVVDRAFDWPAARVFSPNKSGSNSRRKTPRTSEILRCNPPSVICG